MSIFNFFVSNSYPVNYVIKMICDRTNDGMYDKDEWIGIIFIKIGLFEYDITELYDESYQKILNKYLDSYLFINSKDF